jgi:hypothetical protein
LKRIARAAPRAALAGQQFPDYANAWPFLVIVYTHLGRQHQDALAAIADQADERAKVRFVATYYRAQVRAALGERDAAFSLLEQGVRDDKMDAVALIRSRIRSAAQRSPVRGAGGKAEAEEAWMMHACW